MSGFRAGQSMTSTKRLPCHVLYGAWHCLGRTQSYVQTLPSPMATLIPQDLDVPMPVHGSIHHDQLTTPPIVDCTPYHDGPRFPSLGWTQASINLSPCLRRTRTRTSLWYRENGDLSLKIQCLPCHTHSRRRRLCSKVSLGHLAGRRDPYPAARSHIRMVRTNIHLPIITDEEPRWSSSFWPFWAVDGLPVAWRFSPNLRASSDVVGQSLDCIAKILLMHFWDTLASWLLLAENFHLPTTLQFAAVFALGNFVAWSPLKIQRNINSLYRNPTLHKSIKMVMARQSSLQVTIPEQTFFILLSLSDPQTILTVFGQSIR